MDVVIADVLTCQNPSRVPKAALVVTIKGLYINTGNEVDVEVPKDIPYATYRSTNFTHFDVPSKTARQNSNKWLTNPDKPDSEVVWVKVIYGNVSSLLGKID